ncbi:MAG: PAS domain S-box protein [Candidatus Melainabacteria bacterium]|nr:PAS domain S-box protein [Candidatus Melainabacteria bacterium]
MRLRLPLTAQVFVLVTIPLVFQLVSLFAIARLQSDAEEELRRATIAKKIADEVNQLSNETLDAMTSYGAEQGDFVMPGRGVIYDLHESFSRHYKKLEKLTENDPESRKIVIEAEKAGEAAFKTLKELDYSIHHRHHRTEIDGKESRKPLWKNLRKYGKDLLSHDLIDLAKSKERYAETSPEVQAQLRQRVQTFMLLAGGANLMITLFVAFYLTQALANKIRRLNENTVRLASDLPLYPVMEGDDELARLDQVFHQMAGQLKEAHRKERALIDNARDIICSVDESSRFVAVNPASLELLAYAPEDLLRLPFVDIVAAEQAASTLEYLDRVKEAEQTDAFETRLKRKDGSIIDVLLSAHFSREEASIFCVIHDITERKEAERLRQEVVAMITHDLRTPLATVSNIFDFLGRGDFGKLSEKGDKYVDSGVRNINRMMTLVNDLLDIEKLKSGSIDLEVRAVNLADALRNCAGLYLALGAEDGIDVTVDSEDDDIKVLADEEKLSRLLNNLVANAVKFSPRGGTVKISLSRRDGGAIISVSDQGPGIPDGVIDRVFERFFQVQKSSRKGLGSGLGLAIVKAIADAHGFRVWAESAEGEGSTFKLLIPGNSLR